MGADEANNNATPAKPKKTFKQKSAENWKACSKFMWDSEHRTCMGRTGTSWLKVLGFYLGFYCALAALWTICMAVFLKTLDGYAPTQQAKYSMLKNNPGMGFWASASSDSTVIYFNSSNSSSYDTYISQLNSTLQMYQNQTVSQLKTCTFGDGANLTTACYYDASIWMAKSNCTPENGYGYSIGKPCVMLRINKVYNWNPQASGWLFTGQNTSTNEIQFNQIPYYMKTTTDPNYIPVSCTGENDGDMDNIINVNFFPSAGFPAFFFPYLNQESGYYPPYVMAQFETVPGRALMIWCRYWTTTVQHDLVDLQGSIHLEMFLMNNLHNNSQFF